MIFKKLAIILFLIATANSGEILDQLNKDIKYYNYKTLIEYPTYIVSYDKTKCHVQWLAYKVTKADVEVKNQKRSFKYYYSKYMPKECKYNNLMVEDQDYDVGHLAPFASQDSTELKRKNNNNLINVVPQHYKLNRGNWKTLENLERRIVKSEGDTWVVVGNIYSRKDKVIPKFMWKVIFGEKVRRFVCRNNCTELCREVSKRQFRRIVKIKFRKK